MDREREYTQQQDTKDPKKNPRVRLPCPFPVDQYWIFPSATALRCSPYGLLP